MPRDFSRTRRVAEQLRRVLSELIRDAGQDDPRLVMVSITGVEVSRDLAHARVYVTYLGEEAQRPDVVAALNRRAGALRGQLGRQMHIRTVPRPHFAYDEAVERGARLDTLISQALAADRAHHRPGEDEGDDEGKPRERDDGDEA